MLWIPPAVKIQIRAEGSRVIGKARLVKIRSLVSPPPKIFRWNAVRKIIVPAARLWRCGISCCFSKRISW